MEGFVGTLIAILFYSLLLNHGVEKDGELSLIFGETYKCVPLEGVKGE